MLSVESNVQTQYSVVIAINALLLLLSRINIIVWLITL